jgi:hypothetical protein
MRQEPKASHDFIARLKRERGMSMEKEVLMG